MLIRKAAYWIPRYMQRAVDNLLSAGLTIGYGQANPRARAALVAPLAGLQNLNSLLSERNQGRLAVVSGREASSGAPLRVGFVGSWERGQRNTQLEFQHLFFGEGPVQVEQEGQFAMLGLRHQAEELSSGVDLLAIEANRMLLWQPTDGDWSSGPARVRMVFDYQHGEPWEAVEKRLRGQKGNLKRLRRTRFTYRISHNDDDFSRFYHDYYVPMVQSRYQGYGDIDAEAGLIKLFHQKGLILFVENEQGETVSAELDVIRHGVLFALLAGVRGGDQELVRQGALAALYYLSLQYGLSAGCTRHDSGVCLPFTTDGVYQHKRLWGYHAELNHWRSRWQLLWAPRSAPAAVAWMQANPYLQEFARQGGASMAAQQSLEPASD